MLKRLLVVAAVAVAGLVTTAPEADAAVVVRRVAPVRRAVYRAALPPYPVARRAVVGPVIGPVYRPYPVYGPAYYGRPGIYAPGVAITF